MTVLLVLASGTAVVILNAFLTFSSYGVSYESVGFWIGSLLPPFLISYLAGGVKKWRNPIAFSICLLLLGGVVPAATHRKTLSSLPEKRMLREVAGTEPLDPNLTTEDANAANAMRQVFASIREFRQAYYSKYDALRPDLNAVCTATSFASGQNMRRVRDAVSTKLDLDRSTSDWLQLFPKLVAAKFDQTNLSAAEKKQYEDGINTGFASSEFLSARREMMATEEKWATATLDLYAFALQNQQQISVGGGKVRIRGDGLVLLFNAKLNSSETLHRELAADTAKINAIQNSSLKKAGVMPSDLGIAN
jgi:hypothetical protein